MPSGEYEDLAMYPPAVVHRAKQVASQIMRGPAETCETRQQFLDGAVPIIAAALLDASHTVFQPLPETRTPDFDEAVQRIHRRRFAKDVGTLLLKLGCFAVLALLTWSLFDAQR